MCVTFVCVSCCVCVCFLFMIWFLLLCFLFISFVLHFLFVFCFCCYILCWIMCVESNRYQWSLQKHVVLSTKYIIGNSDVNNFDWLHRNELLFFIDVHHLSRIKKNSSWSCRSCETKGCLNLQPNTTVLTS